MGKLLVVIGVVLVIIGLAITYGPKLPFIGKLPGDIAVEKANYRFYFPITTSILISVLLSIVLYLINRWRS